jgi:hypothetical protein
MRSATSLLASEPSSAMDAPQDTGFSKRNFVAVSTFMGSAFLTAYLTAPSPTPIPSIVKFLRDTSDPEIKYWDAFAGILTIMLALSAMTAPIFHKETNANHIAKLGLAAIFDALFSVGLYVSQMVYPQRVFGF